MLNSPKACRSGHPCEPDGAKEVLHCAIAHSAAGCQGVADILGRSAQYVRDAINPNDPDWLSMKHLSAIARATADHPVLAHYIARLQNGFFVPRPNIASGAAQSALYSASAAALSELAEAMKTIEQKFNDDNRISLDELPSIDKECDDVVRAVFALKDVARRLAGVEESQ